MNKNRYVVRQNKHEEGREMRYIILSVVILTIYFFYNAKPLMSEEAKYDHLKTESSADDWKGKSDSYWKERLSAHQYAVCRQSGTERAFTGKYNKHYESGNYLCSNCGLVLFDGETKFDSGSGWPSFYDVSKSENIKLLEDKKFGMSRVEVKCNRCDAHLGHVFPDGPKPTGKRYCINSVCLVHEADLP